MSTGHETFRGCRGRPRSRTRAETRSASIKVEPCVRAGRGGLFPDAVIRIAAELTRARELLHVDRVAPSGGRAVQPRAVLQLLLAELDVVRLARPRLDGRRLQR